VRTDDELLALTHARMKRARELQAETARAAKAGGRRRYLFLRGGLQYGGIFLTLSVALSGALAPGWTPFGVTGGIQRIVARAAWLLLPMVALGLVLAARIWRRLERDWFHKFD
jgi:hypothetical protein